MVFALDGDRLKRTIALKTLAIALLLMAPPASAEDHYTLTITVTSTKNVESQYESGSSAARGVGNFSGARSSFGHSVTRHILAVGSDGNLYDLTPQDPKDFLIPGDYPAYLTTRGMVVGGPQVCSSGWGSEVPCAKQNPKKHRKIKLNIVGVESIQAAQ
jgi:hypothetical protein